MSHHIYNTHVDSRPVQLLVGWDKLLQDYFLVIEKLDSDGEEKPYLYSSLEEPETHAMTLTFIRALLADYHINLPADLWVELERDQKNNVGYRRVGWSESSTV